MRDIVRILHDAATAKEMEYHYGSKAAINLLDPETGLLTNEKIYLLHEFTNRKSEYNTSGTRITAINYEGKFFLVKHSDYDQVKYSTAADSTSKYTQNIEPLLTVFGELSNYLSCAGIEITQWDNMDVTDALDANMDGLLCSYKIKVNATWEPVDNGGGTDPDNSCDSVENFTGFTTGPGTNNTTLFTFTGGNLLGETVVNGLGITVVLPEGVNTLSFGLGVGVYTVIWQKRCDGQLVGFENEQEYEVVNSGTNTKRLTVKEPFDENNVQFPVSVAIVTPSSSTFDTVVDSGIIANDENEFVTIWNDLNGALGTISNPVFRIFPSIRYWEYTITMNDYQLQPTAMWCFLP